MSVITEETWKAELERLAEAWKSRPTAEGLTTPEWARRLGISINMARTLLAEAKARGVLVIAKARREALDGRISMVPVYAMRKSPAASGPTRRAARTRAG